MAFEFQVSFGYKDIFDDYETARIEDFIKAIPSVNFLEIIAFFLAQLQTYERDQSKQFGFLNIWMNRLPNEIRERINEFIQKVCIAQS